jgi:predicted Zn-dependent protease
MILKHLARALAFLALAACAAPPTPGEPPRTVAARSVAEQRIGDQSHPRILAQFGGEYRNARLQSYVNRIGARLAAQTEQPQGPWTFTVLDSPIVNAFALPGGYVYVTRGLIALANDEAELAGVIGHEMGHVTAAHSMRRQETATVAQVGVLAAVIGAAVLGADRAVADAVGQLASAGAQGAVASYSRAQELEADRLGVAYLARAGYDPLAQADFLRSMQAQDQLSASLRGGAHDPNRVDFFATHPATADRIAAATAAAGREGAGADRGRDRFLAAIDGMTYGDSAAQGFVRGARFVHPDLRFEFAAPPGFTITNAAEQVTMRGPRGAGITFDGARDPGGSLERYIAAEWAPALARQVRTGPLQQLRSQTIGGQQAASAILPVQTPGGVRALTLTAIRAPGGTIYRFLGVADPRDAQGLEAVRTAGESFRVLTAAQAAQERPWRLSVVQVRSGDTVARLAARMPFDRANEQRFRVLNGMGPNDELRPGDRVKLVLP